MADVCFPVYILIEDIATECGLCFRITKKNYIPTIFLCYLGFSCSRVDIIFHPRLIFLAPQTMLQHHGLMLYNFYKRLGFVIVMKPLQHRLKVLKVNPFNLVAKGVLSIDRNVILKSSQAGVRPHTGGVF